MMASAQVVETTVNTNNSPSQDYTTNPDNHSNHNKVACLLHLLVFLFAVSKLLAAGQSFQITKWSGSQTFSRNV